MKRAALTAASALLAAWLVGAAQAQLGGGIDRASDTSGELADTDQTPKAKPADDLWKQVAGARYGWDEDDGPDESGVVKGSATRFHTDLHAVAFRNTKIGAAGGSERIDCDNDGEPDTYVPVIYRYDNISDNIERGWAEIPKQELGSDCDHPGYVGTIAWIGRTGRALAVGGTGVYPKREPPYSEDGQELEPDPATGGATKRPKGAWGEDKDPAGAARAWLYEQRRWRELDLSRETRPCPAPPPEEWRCGMRGMTALAFWPHSSSEREFGVAGALGQLWEWERDGDRAGGFAAKVTDGPAIGAVKPLGWDTWGWLLPSPAEEAVPVGTSAQIRFRVRDIEMPSKGTTQSPVAFAVTDGCCADSPARNSPRLLGYTGRSTWHVQELGRRDMPRPDPYTNVRQDMPDSFYSITARTGARIEVSVVAAAGGPETDGERASIVTQPFCVRESGANTSFSFAVAFVTSQEVVPDQLTVAPRTSVSSARLVAGDGDVETAYGGSFILGGTGAIPLLQIVPESYRFNFRPSRFNSNLDLVACSPYSDSAEPGVDPDGVPDWVVGELRSTRRSGLGARALALATALNANLIPDFVRPTTSPSDLLAPVSVKDPTAAGDSVTSRDKLVAYSKSAYFLLPSYSLNAIDMIGDSSAGWAVGEHGAILRLGADDEGGDPARRRVEPSPPALGSREAALLPERHPYDAHRPAPAAGMHAVPAFPERPREHSAEGRLFGVGTPGGDDVTGIVLSRDGSEGWAIGGADKRDPVSEAPLGGTSLYRYEHGHWGRCDTHGVEGQVEPDPACAALKPLREQKRTDRTGNIISHPVRFLAAARAPLERDSDPSNDDRFELLATGSFYQGRGAVLRYRGRRWEIATDESARQLRELLPGHFERVGPFSGAYIGIGPHQLALATPEEGWLLDSRGGRLLRLEDGEWSVCAPGSAVCDPDGLLADIALGITNEGGVTGPQARMVELGGRVYLGGTREVENLNYPAILYRDPGERSWRSDPAGGGYDPGRAPSPDPAKRGVLGPLGLARRAGGGLEGWAAGRFGEGERATPLLRLEPGAGWAPFADAGDLRATGTPLAWQLVLPGADADTPALVGAGRSLYRLEAGGGLWRRLREPEQGDVQALAPDGEGGAWVVTGGSYFSRHSNRPPRPVFDELRSPLRRPSDIFTALAGAPDGALWAGTASDTLYRYDRMTGWDRVAIPGWLPRRVTGRPPGINALAIGPDGRGLVVGKEGRIAKFDQARVALDAAAGTVCDLAAPAPPCGTSRDLRAVSIAPDGSALAGGDYLALLWRPAGGELRAIDRPAEANTGARITGVSLPRPDRAWLTTNTGLVFAGELSGQGSWRWKLDNLDAEGDVVPLDEGGFQIPLQAIAVDAAGRGYAVGDGGVILERGGDPRQPWRRLRTPFLDSLTALAMPAGGGGPVLVGGRNGLVLTGERGRFALARPADYPGSGVPLSERTGPVVGLALAGGPEPGQVEAWAATRGGSAGGFRSPGSDVDPFLPEGGLSVNLNGSRGQLFHFASDPAGGLLDPDGRTSRPLPDAPAPRPGEIALAAFGNSGCAADARGCGTEGVGRMAEIRRRIGGEIAARARARGGPEFAVFTGDALAAAGDGPELKRASTGHLRWLAEIVEPLGEAGLPLFGAIGKRDLSDVPPKGISVGDCFHVIFVACEAYGAGAGAAHRIAKSGENFAWRKAMAGRPVPWGGAEAPERGSLRFRPLLDGTLSVRERDAGAEDPTEAGAAKDTETQADREKDRLIEALKEVSVSAFVTTLNVGSLAGGQIDQADQQADAARAGAKSSLPDTKVALDGAATHYALDLIDESKTEGRELARLVFVDNSLRSLAASDPLQQPVEATGGQAAWLEAVLCLEGAQTSTGDRCTRKAHQQAIVVANTPTYSYGVGAGEETATDSSVFESLLMEHRASLVVSGRLGWQARYWATAPGLHEPCPGEDYRDAPPQAGRRACGRSAADLPFDPSAQAPVARGLSDAVRSLVPPPPPEVGERAAGALGEEGLLPFVIAAAAGGPYGAGGADAVAEEGFWPGYTLARLDRSGDPRATIVEQRPILDWVRLDAATHVLRPRQKLTLHGDGREPIGRDHHDQGSPKWIDVRFDAIQNPGITHRYDLVEADPERPYLPTRDADGSYVLLDPAVATVDGQTGRVKAGKGKHARTFAIALLSVAEKVATWPLVFEPRKSFVPKSPRVAPAPPVRPVVLSQPPEPPPPPAPNPPGGTTANVSAPSPAAPPPPAQSLEPPPITAPTPPSPPLPPGSAQSIPLNVAIEAPAVAVVPPPGVFPPPAPPVQPAPPSGARREARQRQAATQKSGVERAQSEIQGLGGDLAEGPHSPGQAMTRRDRVRPGPSFTAVSRPEQPSAWARGTLYGGGLTLMALALALSWTRGRPGPRRREPTLPAPAWSRAERHGR